MNAFVIGVLAILILGAIPTVSAQVVDPFPKGIGIELGGGHNELIWHSIYDPQRAPDYSHNSFFLTPTVRVSYTLHVVDRTDVLPFFGYTRFGGKQSPKPNGYHDEFWFDALEMGLITTYSVEFFHFGLGGEANRHLKATSRWFGDALAPSNEEGEWNETEVTDWFRDWSFDLGLRMGWGISNVTLAAEAWFGVTQLENSNLDQFINIRQNHYRMLLGYKL